MLGAIIGDIIGSEYEILEARYKKEYNKPRPYNERMKIMDKSTLLFSERSSVTDDSILTCAIAKAILNYDHDYEKYLKEYGLRELDFGNEDFNRGRFGYGFVKWLQGSFQGESYGNGGAMRVSPIGYLESIDEVKSETYLATIPSHNNFEAIQGAEAVSTSIYLLRQGQTLEKVEKYIKENYYSLDYDLENLRRQNMFTSRTSLSVPVALYVFTKSLNFEDAIRKAISVGGDADTIASIVGALSEAYYGLDQELVESVKPYLRDYMLPVIEEFYKVKKLKIN